jgi:large subunit ribosomal protein L23
MNTIVIRPHITEKTLNLASRGWYTFSVAPDASKQNIKDAVSLLYKVTVIAVRTISMHGKMRRVGKVSKPVKREDWKKAMVSLKKGQKIDVFEVTGQPVTEKPVKETKKV